VETVQWLSSSSSSVSKNSSAKIKRCQKYVVVLYVRVKAFNIVRCIVCVRVCLCVCARARVHACVCRCLYACANVSVC
jgi:hypothetical protein